MTNPFKSAWNWLTGTVPGQRVLRILAVVTLAAAIFTVAVAVRHYRQQPKEPNTGQEQAAGPGQGQAPAGGPPAGQGQPAPGAGAAQAGAAVPPAAPEAAQAILISHLIVNLKDENSGVVEKAKDGLFILGGAAAPELVKALEDKDRRLEAARCLLRIRAPAVKPLIEGFASADPQARRHAKWVIYHIGSDVVAEELRKALQDPRADVKQMAEEILLLFDEKIQSKAVSPPAPAPPSSASSSTWPPTNASARVADIDARQETRSQIGELVSRLAMEQEELRGINRQLRETERFGRSEEDADLARGLRERRTQKLESIADLQEDLRQRGVVVNYTSVTVPVLSLIPRAQVSYSAL